QITHTETFYCTHAARTQTITLSLHDALPISHRSGAATARREYVPVAIPGRSPPHAPAGWGPAPHARAPAPWPRTHRRCPARAHRSEEHTSELQSRENLVCRLQLEKKKNNKLT